MVWNDAGTFLLSGSDDCTAIIWKWASGSCVSTRSSVDRWQMELAQQIDTGHRGNIFGVAFVEDCGSRLIATCAMDGEVRIHDIKHNTSLATADASYSHHGFARQLATAKREGSMLWSIADDGIVAQWDHREQAAYPIISLPYNSAASSATSLLEGRSVAANPSRPHLLAVAASDAFVRVYDRRMLKPLHTRGVNGTGLPSCRLWSSACEAHLPCELFAPEHLVPELAPSTQPPHIQYTLHNHEESIHQYPTHCAWDDCGETLLATYSRDGVYAWRVFRDASQGSASQVSASQGGASQVSASQGGASQGGASQGEPPLTSTGVTAHTQVSPSGIACVSVQQQAALLASAAGASFPARAPADASQLRPPALQGLHATRSFLVELSNYSAETGTSPQLPHCVQQALLGQASSSPGSAPLAPELRSAAVQLDAIQQQAAGGDEDEHTQLEAARMGSRLAARLLELPLPSAPWQQGVQWTLLARQCQLHTARPQLYRAMHFATLGMRTNFLQSAGVSVLARCAARLCLWGGARAVLRWHKELLEECLELLTTISCINTPVEISIASEEASSAAAAGAVATQPLLKHLCEALQALLESVQALQSEVQAGFSTQDHPLHTAETDRASVQTGSRIFAEGRGSATHDGQAQLEAVVTGLFSKVKAAKAQLNPPGQGNAICGGAAEGAHAQRLLGGSACARSVSGWSTPAPARMAGQLPIDTSGVFLGARNADTDIKECRLWDLQLPPAWRQLVTGQQSGRAACRPHRVRVMLAGSDDGCVYVWSCDSGRLLARLPSDPDIVNCVAPHPTLPVLAVSGIAHDISLWGPTSAMGCRPLGDTLDEELHSSALHNLLHLQGDVQPMDGSQQLMEMLQALRDQQAREGDGGDDGDASRCPQQ